ncbi:hypothetical protein AGR1B_Cc120492 [Agrobacterium fabacearum S56]|uniref:hypothetical protein n=1 Tax=Agrobacterium tumefaciens TaxID=358 RepID=UPI0009BAC499|nr:hypothetical protein [Agrobacterium tumefaciens]CUW90115.1 hypothetical protein AGR1B_Cc120492 [Agrobacterium fabacearum S56]
MKQIPQKPLPPSLLSQRSTGEAAAAEIKLVADYLAELMRGLHGCDWQILIDHQVRFIMIAAQGERKPS